MQKHFFKFRKVFTSIVSSPLILISNNSELAAKYLPNDFKQSITTLEINKINNNFKEQIYYLTKIDTSPCSFHREHSLTSP